MEITVTHDQGQVPVTIFHIVGEINVNTYEQLQQRAEEEYRAGMRDLLLDLTQVTFISSAGLRAVHALFLLLRDDSAEENEEAVSRGLRDGTYKSLHLMLLNPQPAVLRPLRTAGFDMYLNIFNDLMQAVDAFGVSSKVAER